MKIAVTGASGFVGSHVLLELARREGLNLVTTSRRSLSQGCVPLGSRHVELDIDQISGAEAFDRLGQPDRLIHLAWAGLPNYRALHHFENHLPQQYRFLSEMVRAGLRSLLCTGTCFEYGMASGELAETRDSDPRNPYGYAKNALRQQLSYLQAQTPFELTWARLFYMYGEGQPASSLYTQFMAAGRRGDFSFKMSRGEQLRDFLHVTSIARLIVDLALLPGGVGVVNICSGQPTSVRSLVEAWRAEQGWEMELERGHYPYPDYEPMAFWGSAARLRAVLAEAGRAGEP